MHGGSFVCVCLFHLTAVEVIGSRPNLSNVAKRTKNDLASEQLSASLARLPMKTVALFSFKKFCKNFQILRHIESLDVYIKY